MGRQAALDHLSRQPNGTYVGAWGNFLLRNAYQPIFSFGQGRMDIAAYEGLIRPFASGDAVSPVAFFSAIKPIDRFGVETLTRTLHVLNAPQRIGSTASLFLNFDPSVFVDKAISDAALRDLKLVLHEAKIDSTRVVCELTEHRTNCEETLFNFVKALKANGFKIAIDDYGIDDSDYARVKALQPQIVKFDGGWIARLMDSRPGAALLKAMVRTFHDMGIRSVFEGLEETWQLDLAYECEADLVQGFVLARPELVPVDVPMEARVDENSQAPDRTEHMPTYPDRGHRHVRAFGRRSAIQ